MTVIPCLRKIQKINESCDTPLHVSWNQQFSTEISQFCYIKLYKYRLHFVTWFLILLTFVVLIKVQKLGTSTWYEIENLHQSGKRVISKSQMIFGGTFVEVTGVKLIGEGSEESPPIHRGPILNRITKKLYIRKLTLDLWFYSSPNGFCQILSLKLCLEKCLHVLLYIWHGLKPI